MDARIRHYCEAFHRGHEEWYANDIPDAEAAAWMEENIPRFVCDDREIEETYYFRFWTYRKHIRSIPGGHVVTEFLPDVPWSGEYNAISCPVGHHIMEGRWLADREIVRDDIRFFLREASMDNTMRYSNTLVWCAYRFILHTGDLSFAEEILPALKRNFAERAARNRTECGLYWSNDGRDGMEYSVSGSGLRPTLNAYEYGAARAIAAICRMTADAESETYERRAEELRSAIQMYLWDNSDGFFKTVFMDERDGTADFARENPERNAMEEIGYLPWCFPGLADREQETAFAYLTDAAHFRAPFGITTADMAHPRFMKNPVRHECLWDGPVWPYATSQTLTGIYTLLADHDSAYIDGAAYMEMLRTYAASQKLYENGKTIRWIDENTEPFTGQWISRDLMRLDHIYEGKFPKERGADYNHSTFCDLVLSGACGISLDCGALRVKPLAAGIWKYFAVTNLTVGNDRFEIYYDKDGTHFGLSAPLTVKKNGKVLVQGNGEIQCKI